MCKCIEEAKKMIEEIKSTKKDGLMPAYQIEKIIILEELIEHLVKLSEE